VGFWDKVKGWFGGKPPSDGDGDGDRGDGDAPGAKPAPVPLVGEKRYPSNRTWTLTKRGGRFVLEAPHGVFPIRGVDAAARGDFDALAEGAEASCQGDYVGGGKTITDLVVTAIGRKAAPVARPAAAPARARAAAPPSSSSPPPPDDDHDDEEAEARAAALRWQANEILGLSAADLRTRALKIQPWRTAWIGRTDTIPPQSDERTALIDRGLILRGLLTPEQLVEIHRIGDLWLRHKDALKLAEAAAAHSAEAAVAAARAAHAAAKAERKRLAAEREAARVAAVAERRATDIIYAGRGVSARLADRRAHVEELARQGLPVLASAGDVARALGLTVPQLRWLCFHSDAAAKTHYVYFEVPKRSGGTRLLAAPHKKLAAAQRWVLENILAKLDVTAYAHGFVAARSTVTNARPHLGQTIVVTLDLKDFFPTITFPRVRGLFESLGYSPAAATLLALLVTEAPRVRVTHDGAPLWVAVGDRALPQGACTSPVISNLVARKLDRRLAGAMKKLGWTYTRYADDLTFSASEPASAQLSLMMSRVRAIVRDEGFAVNEAKGRVARASARQRVTGIVVNDKLGLPREELRRLRAILHRAKTTGLPAQNRESRADFEAYLRGKIAYLHMIDPARAAPLLAALDAVAPKS
jgi:retron-type reverse transcriptase